jgi:Stage II sporulation protein E (SpoIIE)
MRQHCLRLAFLQLVVLVGTAATISAAGQPVATTAGTAALRLGNLGDGAVALDGSWRFKPGDDAGWANPNLDDSGWEAIAVDKAWGEQGHPSYTGFGWYRRHIEFAPANPKNGAESAEHLALMIRHIDDAYEIFWNGARIGGNGAFPPHPVWYPISQPPQTFAWPATGSGVLAIRVWKAPLLSDDSGRRGGILFPPVVGTSAAIVAAKAQLDYQWLRSRQFVFGEDLLYALVALLSLLAWLRDRRQLLLLWVATFALASIFRQMLFGMGIDWPRSITDALAGPLSSIRDVSLWFLLLALLQLREKRRLLRLTWAAAVVSLTATTLDGLISLFLWTSRWLLAVQVADALLTVIYILTAAMPLVLVAFAYRQQKRLEDASWLVAILAFLSGMIQVLTNIAPQGSRFTHWTLADKIETPLFTLNSNAISIVPLAGMLLLLSIVYAVFRNAMEERNRQLAIEQEFRSARELQRVLIPETQQTLPGFELTSSYLPAAEVGGDFFQLITGEGDKAGSTIVILGDVSGKGLKAAMSVSLIVGAARTLAETTTSPGDILAGINRRLIGRMQGGFVTCIILRLDPDGDCLLANAGHLPPFLNFEEMELQGALPLGLIPGLIYDELRFHLSAEDRLSLYTDGLLEARSPAGEIFGFDRLRRLMGMRPSAAQAAQAAVSFGQDDDITVLTLTRL